MVISIKKNWVAIRNIKGKISYIKLGAFKNESINGKFTLYSGSLYLVAWEKHSLHLAIYWWDIYWEEYSLKNENWEHFKKVVNS